MDRLQLPHEPGKPAVSSTSVVTIWFVYRGVINRIRKYCSHCALIRD
jgi:hypothetical protein